MNRGSTMVMVDPYALGVGLRAKTRMGLRGLGEEPAIDYGTEARRLALSRQATEAANRVQDQQDAAQQAFERQQVLQIAQDAAQKAERVQANILTSGQNQLRRLLFSGSIIATLSLAALTIVSLTGPRKRKRKRSGSSRSRSRSSRRHRRVRRRVQTKLMSFSEKVGS